MCELLAEVCGIDVMMRRIARCAVADDAAALRRADEREGRRPGMSTAFGAARDVDKNAVALRLRRKRKNGSQRGCKRSRRNQS